MASSSKASGRGPFRLMAFVLGVTAFGAGLPTPLYSVYQHEYGFSSLALGGIFASYVVGVLLTMFLVAPQSDQIGTRPVLYFGMVLTALAGLAFVLADGTAWLAVARFVSGLAVGATTSTATVSMTNREPRGDKHHVARVAVAANFGGVASGVLLSSVAVEWLPRPTQTPYLCLILAAGVAVGLLLVTPRRYHGPHRPETVRIERISVPKELRGPFWVSVGGLTSCYAIYGFFASLAPTAVRAATRIPAFEAAAFVALMFGSAALVQIFLGQVRDRNALLFGLPLLVLALALFVIALPPGSVPLLIVGGVLMGIAVGFVYMGSITLIDRVAPDKLRGEILSGFHLSGYLALAVPTLCLAFLAGSLGVVTSGAIFGVAIGSFVFLTYWATRRTALPPGGEGRPLHPPTRSGPPIPEKI
jgi:MFS family permease